jgi:4-hydroxybenzoate polyprenyltransferase
MVIGFITHYVVIKRPDIYAQVEASKLMRRTFLYAGFAFIISLVREVVKDMEDIYGDARYGCRTMPIVWGINASKVFAATWVIVLLAGVLVMQAYVLPFNWWWAAAYSVVFIVVPLVMLLRKLVKAVTPADFHKISTWLKFIMLSGILSMLFFKLYT